MLERQEKVTLKVPYRFFPLFGRTQQIDISRLRGDTAAEISYEIDPQYSGLHGLAPGTRVFVTDADTELALLPKSAINKKRLDLKEQTRTLIDQNHKT
jgi:hypothetical protein